MHDNHMVVVVMSRGCSHDNHKVVVLLTGHVTRLANVSTRYSGAHIVDDVD